MAKKSAKSKGFRRQTTKKPYLSKKEIIILIVILAALAAAAIALFSYDDGALKVKDGAVVTGGDNWLIVNGSNTRGGTRYYKLGEIGELDGYTRTTQYIGTDSNIPEFSFAPQAEGDGIDSVGVTTSHNGAAALASYASGTFSAMGNYEVGEVQTLELDDGTTCSYYLYSIDYAALEEADAGTAEEASAEEAPAEETAEEAAEETPAEEAPAEEATEEAAEEAPAEEAAEESAEEEPQFTRYLSGYRDAAHDSCIVVQVVDKAASAEACVDDETMIEAMRQALTAVTLEEGK